MVVYRPDVLLSDHVSLASWHPSVDKSLSLLKYVKDACDSRTVEICHVAESNTSDTISILKLFFK